MTTMPNQNNNKRQYQPNRRNSTNKAIWMKPNYNMIANMNYYKLLPAKDVKTHLREVITPREGDVWETTHLPMEKQYEPI